LYHGVKMWAVMHARMD